MTGVLFDLGTFKSVKRFVTLNPDALSVKSISGKFVYIFLDYLFDFVNNSTYNNSFQDPDVDYYCFYFAFRFLSV